MLSRLVLQSCFKQRDCVCLLASYAFMLESFGVFKDTKSLINTVYDVFAYYCQYHNTLSGSKISLCNFTAQEIKADPDKERIVGLAINYYCQNNGNIAGYQHIKSFHEWLINEGIVSSNIQCVVVEPAFGADRTIEIANAYSFLCNYLNCDNYCALVLYRCGTAFHSVFLGRDQDGFFIRDPNFTCVKGNITSHSFVFDLACQILEYMVFHLEESNPDK